jgi:hypothetical protein
VRKCTVPTLILLRVKGFLLLFLLRIFSHNSFAQPSNTMDPALPIAAAAAPAVGVYYAPILANVPFIVPVWDPLLPPLNPALVQQAMQMGMQPADLLGMTDQQLGFFLAAHQPPPAALAPLTDSKYEPGHGLCVGCWILSPKVYCSPCKKPLCYKCMDAAHADAEHKCVRYRDVIDCVDLTDDGDGAVDRVVKYGAVPLCGHRDTYSSAACTLCQPLMRMAKTQCVICLDDVEGMLTTCPSCANPVGCASCWKTLVTDAVRHGKHVSCPLCRVVVV